MDCYWCQRYEVCGKLDEDPVFEYERDSGTKEIDVRSWFGLDYYDCYIDIYFRESDYSDVNSRIFTTDRY